MKKILQILIVGHIFFTAHNAYAGPIGQRFILTLPETHDKKQLAQWLVKTKPAGVMLLAYHCLDRAKTKELITFLQLGAKKLGIPPLLISIDWEGGIVSRPSEAGGWSSVPSPWSLAQAGRPACFLAGCLIGAQCRSAGINMVFAPLLDQFNRDNRILATRCFSSSPEKIAEFGIAFANGLMSQGVIPVVKHFPGLGLGRLDTHNEQVTINVNDATLQLHMLPFFRALKNGIPAVMVTHAVYRQFGSVPASQSTKAVSYLNGLNPAALVITDDIGMLGAKKGISTDECALLSLEAGCDLIIYSGKPQEQIATLTDPRLISYEDLHEEHKTKKRLTQGPLPFVLEEKKLASWLAARCSNLVGFLPDMSSKKCIMISVNLPVIRTPEKWFVMNGKSYLGRALEKRGFAVDEYVLNPKDEASLEKLDEIIALIEQEPDAIVILQTCFYADNIWNSIQKEWIMRLQQYQRRMIALSLGHPEEQYMLPGAGVINLGSFQKPLLDNVVSLLSTKSIITGADYLAANPAEYLKNKRFGLVCHRCSTDARNRFLPDVLYKWSREQHDKTKLAAIFAPEHGLMGTAQAFAHIKSEEQSRWDCPVYSLHGDHRKPTAAMLKGLDLIIIDFQEVGVRCFTYLSSMKLVLEAAAQERVPVLVLDRPNPIVFWGAQGPLLESQHESFLGKLYVPFLHGMTIGQLAQLANKKIGANLRVLKASIPLTAKSPIDMMSGRRFVAPSPNLSTLDHLLVYPMTVFLEGTNYSEGRGTRYPFLQIGGPWVNSRALAHALNAKKLAGVYFEPVSFTPKKIEGVAENPKHKDVVCHGVFVHVYDQTAVQPMVVAQTILNTLFQLYPKQSTLLQWGKRYALDNLVGSSAWREELQKKIETP